MVLARLVGRWRQVSLLGVFAVVCGSGFVLVYEWTVRTTPGRLLGDASLRGAMLTNSRVGVFVDGVLRVVSVASLLGAVAAVALIALVRLCRSLGLAAVGLLVGANVSAWVLKNMLLSRPDLGLREVSPATLNSLPSGHIAATMSAVAALLFVVPARWRGVLAAAGAGYACLTAVATMSAGWHRAGDSVAAFLLVGVWAAAAGLAVVILDGPTERAVGHRPAAPRARRRLAMVAGGCLAVGIAVASLLYATAQVRGGVFATASAFLAGGLFIVGTATAVLAGVLVVLDRVAPSAATGAGDDGRDRASAAA